jgi:hypothetical protein
MSAFIVRSTLRVRLLSLVLLITLLMFLTPVRPGETAAPTRVCGDVGVSDLVVTYVSATPSILHVGDKLVVDFRALGFAPNNNGKGNGNSDPVGQCVSACAHKWKPCTQNEPMCGDCKESCRNSYQPAHGFGVSEVHFATFVLGSLTTGQTSEYQNTPVSPGASDGEYRAMIQITGGAPTGQVLVYVEAQSLQGSVYGRTVTGPLVNTSSEETEDTSGSSVVQIYESQSVPANSPSVAEIGSQSVPTRPFGQLTLVALGLIAILLLPIYVVVRRRREQPSSQ